MNYTAIVERSYKQLFHFIPLLFIAVLIGTIVEVFASEKIVSQLVGNHVVIAIPLATLLGITFPLPRYASYPLAAALLAKGLGFGVVFALVAGEVISESVAREYAEIKYFGSSFFFTKVALCFIFITLGAFVIEVLI